MLKKIIIIGFLLSGFLLAQQYSNDKYEKYVGTKLGKYPLTVTGLKKAISALDSGVVYISYPGLWDTTGLGAIPSNIRLVGYLFGQMTYTLFPNSGNIYKYLWTDGTGSFANLRPLVDPVGEESYAPFTFMGRQSAYWGIISIYNAIDKFWSNRSIKSGSRLTGLDIKLIADTSYKGVVNTLPSVQGFQSHIAWYPDSSTTNSEYNMFVGMGSSIDYKQQYQDKQWWGMWGINNKWDLKSGTDTILAGGKLIGLRSEFGVASDVYFNTDVYGVYSYIPSVVSNNLIGTNKAYHFYGNGNFPLWNGGSINSGAGYNFASDTSSTDDYKIVLAGAHTIVAGLEVTFKASTANDSSSTLQINSLTATPLTKASSGAVNTSLSTGDILAGQIVKAVYDGTQFQIISRLVQ